MKYRKTIITVIGATVLISAISACNRGPWGHHGHGNPEQRVEWIKEEIDDHLDLTESQNSELDRLADTLMAIYLERQPVKAQHKSQLRDLIAAPTLDQSQAMTMVSQHTSFVNSKAPEVIAAIASFTDTLDTQQKQEITQRLDRWAKRYQKN